MRTLLCLFLSVIALRAAGKPNVLFIMADDFRPEMGLLRLQRPDAQPGPSREAQRAV